LSYLARGGKSNVPAAIAELQAELARDPNDYYANYLLGMVYVTERRLDEAVPLLETAMRLDSLKPDAPLFLGQALVLKGEDDKAIPILQRAIQLTTDPSRNQYQISNAHYMLAQIFRRKGRMEEAANHASLTAKYKANLASRDVDRLQEYLNPSSAGVDALKNESTGIGDGPVIGEPEPPGEAEKLRLEKAEKALAGIAGQTYNQLGFLSAGQSDFKRAARYFERAAHWDPDIHDVDYNAGLACFKAEEYRKALAPLERARLREPDRMPVRVLLGLSYFFNDDYRRALELLGPLTGAGVDDPQVMFAFAVSLAHTGDRQRGHRILQDLSLRYPQAAELHLAMGQLHALEEDYAAAAAAFNRALQINPSLPDAHYYAGLAMLRQSRFEDAAGEFRREVERNPQHARAHYHLAFALAALQRTDEAVKLFEEVIRLDPGYAEAFYELGKIRLQQGGTQDAIKLLEKAVQSEPGKSYAYYQLSLAYQKAGRRDEAQAAMTRYQQLKAAERAKPQ
jgi:tetratricopeptide (TPR) repeat protein